MIDFPDSPTTGDTFRQWEWDGSAWIISSSATTSTPLSTMPLSLNIAPPELVSNLYARWRADDIPGSDGDAITAVSDLSGNARDLAGATGEEPVLKLNQANGRRAIRFASGDQLTYTPGAALAAPHTLFVVTRFPRSAVLKYAVGSPYVLLAATTGQVSTGGSTVATGGADGNMAVWTIQVTSTGTSVWRNGSPMRSNSALTSSVSKFTIGGDGSGTYKGLDNGEVFEVCVYSATLSAQDRHGIEHFLCNYYGIPYTPRTTAVTMTSATVSSQGSIVWTPVDYDANVPQPLLLVSHGGGQSETVVSNTDFTRIVDVALQLGWIVAASNEGTSTWRPGSSDALDDCDNLIAHIESNYCDIERIVTAGVSYGGQSSLHNLRRLAKAVGWLGIAPVCDSSVSPTSPASVSNPMTDATSSWTGKRMLAFGSTGDSIVNPSNHGVPMIARGVSGGAYEATYVACSGGHIDLSHYQPTPVAAFLQRCRAMAVSA